MPEMTPPKTETRHMAKPRFSPLILGAALGVVIGTLTGKLGLWLGVCGGLGILLGFALRRREEAPD